jgi:hypothetical protein
VPGPGGRGAVRGVGILGSGVAGGRGVPGVGIDGGAFGKSPSPAGSGWRGPEIICPGLGAGAGAGTGLAGIDEPRATGGATGTPGCPVASGGLNGCAGRGGIECSSVLSFDASAVGTVSVFVTGSAFAAGCVRTGSAAGAGAGSSTTDTSGSGSSCALEGAAPLPLPPAKRRRTSSATSSSSELECVFLSLTPSSGNSSRMTFGLTSSSRASSLIRILLIRWRPDAGVSSARDQTIQTSPRIGKLLFSRILCVLYPNRFIFLL